MTLCKCLVSLFIFYFFSLFQKYSTWLEKQSERKLSRTLRYNRNFLGRKRTNKAFKDRKNKCVVHFYFKIATTERQVWYFCLFVWKLVGSFTGAKWNSFISWERCHPDKPLLNALKPDFGFWFGTHCLSSQALSSFFPTNFNLQVSEWKEWMGHHKFPPDYCNLKPEKSLLIQITLVPLILHEWCCNKSRGLGFHKHYF